MLTHYWHCYHGYTAVRTYVKIMWAPVHVYTDSKCCLYDRRNFDNPEYLYNVTILTVSTSYSLYDITLIIQQLDPRVLPKLVSD